MRKVKFFAGMLLAGLLQFQCSLTPLSEGPGSETVRIYGSVVDLSGAPAGMVRVILLPAAYDPQKDAPVSDSLVDTTDATGRYSLAATHHGNFTIEAVQINGPQKALITGVAVSTTNPIIVPQATLHGTGIIKVVFPGIIDAANGYLFLPGTTSFSLVKSQSVLIQRVPAGVLPAVYFAETDGPSAPREVGKDVTVRSGDTTVITDYSLWKYSKKLYLNTTGSGAGVATTHVHFPALVRLNPANFNFAEGLRSGADLRFTKSDNATPLPYEIETWDSAGSRAAVWVKVDTVYGNDASHFIVMHWGTAKAVPVSAGESVFDTGAGFQGVWHLNGSGNAGCLDATVNRFNGTPSDTSPTSIAQAMVGGGQTFNGTSNYFTIAGSASGKLNFPEFGTYSVSAWVSAASLDSLYHVIVGKSDRQYGLQIMSINKWEFIEVSSAYHFKSVRADARASEWTLLTAVRDGNREFLYVNGIRADTGITIAPDSVLVRDTSNNVMIGRVAGTDFPERRFFNGAIDEVRIADIAYNTDWIRLCYMNQKKDDALFIFRDQK